MGVIQKVEVSFSQKAQRQIDLLTRAIEEGNRRKEPTPLVLDSEVLDIVHNALKKAGVTGVYLRDQIINNLVEANLWFVKARH